MLVLVKANAYGHGDVEISKLLEEFGADYLGVAFPCEGIRLMENGIKLPVIVLTPGYDNFEEIVNHGLEPSITDMEALKFFSKTLEKTGNSKYPVHIKIDSGMHRVGFNKENIEEMTGFILKNGKIEVKSIFSHLAAADEKRHDEFTLAQIKLFEENYRNVTNLLGYRPIKHILNSSGIERFSQYGFDMVRLGVGIYGTSYVDETRLRPVGSLIAPIVQLKTVREGTIGYGRRGETGGIPRLIASVPLGYADGIDRHFSRGNASFMVNGKPAPVIGNICMDMFMLDVTGIDVKCGDMVTIFGEKPTAGELAEILGTISYEIYTSVSARVKRIVVE
jgi:alanine racemase